MKLSVIIVSYNCKVYLDYCIQSVISALKNIHGEVIVIDNNSTDNTKDFIHAVSPRLPSKYSRRFVNVLADISLIKVPEGLYSREYKWGKYKIKLSLRSTLKKLGLIKFIKNIKENKIF